MIVLFISTASLEGGRAPGLVYIFALYHYNTTYRMMRVGTQTQKTTQVAPRRAVHIKKSYSLHHGTDCS